MDLWTLTQQFGFPIAFLIIAIVAIQKKVFVPGWYSTYLEEQNKTKDAKIEALTQRTFELASYARTAVEVGKAALQKESA